MKRMLTLLLAFLLCLSLLPAAVAEEQTTVDVQVTLTYCYDMTESMLPLINAFRAEDGVWYWNEDNATKTVLSDLPAMTYDYGLETVAMQRAAECAIYYSHTRPDGTPWYTIYPEAMTGENIAAGFGTVQDMFDGWREEEEPYEYQGHRRNMLEADFLYVGVGCVCSNGTYFWAQALSASPTGESRSSLKGPAKVTVSVDNLADYGVSNMLTNTGYLFVNEGESVAYPPVSGYSGVWGETPIVMINPPWVSTDESILSTAGGKITGVSGGEATLRINLYDPPFELDATVICKNHVWDQGQVIEEATADKAGKKLYTCTVCQETKEEEIPKVVCTNHVWDQGQVITAATYQAAGKMRYTCVNCQTTKEEEIPKLVCTEHQWDNGQVIEEATADKAGIKRYTCTVCQQTKDEEIPKLSARIPGDVTGDGKVNLSDVVRLLKYVSKWDVTINAANSDVTGDGKVTLSDVVRLLKYVSKWDVTLQ